jgi:hypothetical protein
VLAHVLVEPMQLRREVGIRAAALANGVIVGCYGYREHYTTAKLSQHNFSFGVCADEMCDQVLRAVMSKDITAGQLLNTEMCTYTASQ